MSLRRLPLPLLLAAACVLAWIGVDFSPGFSESFAACFVTAQLLVLLIQTPFSRWIGLLGVMLLTAGSYIYAAGDDFLSVCCRIALAALLLCAVFQLKAKCGFSEGLLRTALLAAGVFTVLCGIFSTALLPLGLGVLLCFAARFSERAKGWLTAAGLLLCDVFLLAPMCFPGGV